VAQGATAKLTILRRTAKKKDFRVRPATDRRTKTESSVRVVGKKYKKTLATNYTKYKKFLFFRFLKKGNNLGHFVEASALHAKSRR
jgi:hypothetical protein